MNLTATEAMRLSDKFTIGDGCWEWIGALVKGYGSLRFRQKHWLAHRFIYILIKGEIPDGLQLDHLCRNRKCVRPDHLEPVTNRENVLRGEGIPSRNYRKTHCPKGHALCGSNILWERNGTTRKCRICHNDRIAKRLADYKRVHGRAYVPPCRRSK